MTTAAGQAGANADGAAQSGWDAVRADDSIQYAPITPPEQQPPDPPPEWLEALVRFLADLLEPVGRALGMSWPVFKWVLLGIGAVLLLWLLWRLLAPVLDLRPRAKLEEDSGWTVDEAAALALLSDADRLAAEGKYDAATHLLLLRSVGQISEARPGLVEPSSTARELSTLAALPEAARNAFGVISERVERSLFALRPLGAEDWQAARSAYADFALQNLALVRA